MMENSYINLDSRGKIISEYPAELVELGLREDDNIHIYKKLYYVPCKGMGMKGQFIPLKSRVPFYKRVINFIKERL